MRNTSIRLLTGLAVMLLSAGGAAAGQWGTNYGTMTLPDTPQGSVRAPYTDDNGRVIGRFYQPKCPGCGVLLSGVWVENSSGKKCSSSQDGSAYWGKVEFDFNVEYNRFSGKWGYCEDSPSRGWTGQLGATRGPTSPSK